MRPLFLGLDVGSSSVKVAFFDAARGEAVGQASYPPTEQPIDAPQPGWAEQDPEMWWTHFLAAYRQALTTHHLNPADIAAIGISYQMHGLVVVGDDHRPLRPAIIWCDSRAVAVGAEAYEALGQAECLPALLNAPGNFTAAKLGWVKTHEPHIFEQIHRFMLPGDYLALKLSGSVSTTAGGLSEGIFWDFPNRTVYAPLVDHFGFDAALFPDRVPGLGEQATVAPGVAEALGMGPGVRITYRAGDQPNNALSLNVLHPGEMAATAGTSGVLYAVTDQDVYDPASRINTFLHVNDTPVQKRNGLLICVNGTGILYRWLRQLLGTGGAVSYEKMNALAAAARPGSKGVQCFPFGNGAERILSNQPIDAHLDGLDFNRHGAGEVVRAGLEGIVYALTLGFDVLRQLQVVPTTIRAGHANLFLSPAFREIFANVTGAVVQLYNTDGAEGAARAAAWGAGFYDDPADAFASLAVISETAPTPGLASRYAEHYHGWKTRLNQLR